MSHATKARRVVAVLITALVSLWLSGCASLVGGALGGVTDSLSNAVLNSDDPQTVRDGAPTLLLLLDGLIEQSPDSVSLLEAGAQLYSAYGAAFVQDPARAQRMADRAFGYARRAICAYDQAACEVRKMDFSSFEAWLAAAKPKALPRIYALGTAWASYIQANSEDWNAIAELARVRAIMDWAVSADETHDGGGAHLYLGVLDTLVPPAMGGKPDEGRAHFERAVELSGGEALMTKVMFARQYARLVYDRELHDGLLREVIAADPVADRLTLINLVAQEQAQALLTDGDDYF